MASISPYRAQIIEQLAKRHRRDDTGWLTELLVVQAGTWRPGWLTPDTMARPSKSVDFRVWPYVTSIVGPYGDTQPYERP